jgi:eukaryotic-like serine/threonine-protein kinase
MSRPTSGLRDGRALRGHPPSGETKAVGKYRVVCELGHGGMANVFLAVAQGTGGVSKLVVLKALRAEFASEPDALTMFLDEARLAAQLNHGNVVQTYEVGQHEDRHVIVMEYLEGQSLARLVRCAESAGQRFPLALHLRVITHVLEGLHYAHEFKGYDGQPLHLVHRDVSPQNVFVTYDGRTKLLDFGIAKAATSTTHTLTGTVKGKIAYMCPEQMSGESVDRRADVYSVGCMLWAAAAGRNLWKDVTDANVLLDVMTGATPTPQSVNPSCDDELSRIVMKAIASDPDSRYASAFELQADLERYCDQADMPDRPRDLGRFVSALFASDRDQLKARVEQELSTPTPDSGLLRPAPESPPKPLSVGEGRGVTSATRTISGSTVSAMPRLATSKRQRLPWIITAAAGLFAAVYLLGMREAPTASKPLPSAGSSTEARIELRATPGNARLFLDGQPLVGNPTLRVMPADGTLHQLRAELDGHRTASAEFSSRPNTVVELQLVRLPPPAPAVAATPPPRTVSPARKSTPVKKPRRAAACTQPFFVDADGIKKVRPGCL